MKKATLFLLASSAFLFSFGQQKEEAEKLVQEGIAYHDKGDYDGAITRYDKALELDKNNLLALSEKATTLLSQEKYDDVVDVCKKAIKHYPNEKADAHIYIVYGNALDGLKKTDESVKIYDKGLKYFPDHYQLYFNKGVTLASVRKYDECLLAFEAAAAIAPQHASSQNAIARIQAAKNNQLPSLLAYWRFLALESDGDRAKANLPDMLKVVRGNVEQKDNKTINITAFMDPTSGKKKENDFGPTQLILNLTSAMDFSDEHKNETDIQKFLRKFETVCSSLKEGAKDGKGFYWSYYVPYFAEMKDKDYLETFAHIVFTTAADAENTQWLKEHEEKVSAFYNWSKNFSFKTN